MRRPTTALSCEGPHQLASGHRLAAAASQLGWQPRRGFRETAGGRRHICPRTWRPVQARLRLKSRRRVNHRLLPPWLPGTRPAHQEPESEPTRHASPSPQVPSLQWSPTDDHRADARQDRSQRAPRGNPLLAIPTPTDTASLCDLRPMAGGNRLSGSVRRTNWGSRLQGFAPPENPYPQHTD